MFVLSYPILQSLAILRHSPTSRVGSSWCASDHNQNRSPYNFSSQTYPASRNYHMHHEPEHEYHNRHRYDDCHVNQPCGPCTLCPQE